MFLLLPACASASAWAASQWLDPWMRARLAQASHARAASFALLRFCVESFAVVAVAYALSQALNAAGWDPRGSFLGTYDQRNALVVGFVMGFAVIPIIYTIADDALSTVPEHLRSASLGAGATTWQTATWIVLPAAMSGVFSAVMVGFGRAVGETMIVLMAAGGTPILDWNPFNGFKTLSVNIANELPESAVGSAHYRILFFSAVVLFFLTSVLNTFAEAVRIRFRRRAYQL
jgi:phosphate transport system permease protein